MRTFNISFLAVLSCIALPVIGANPIGSRSSVESEPETPEHLGGLHEYVTLQQLYGVLSF